MSVVSDVSNWFVNSTMQTVDVPATALKAIQAHPPSTDPFAGGLQSVNDLTTAFGYVCVLIFVGVTIVGLARSLPKRNYRAAAGQVLFGDSLAGVCWVMFSAPF